VAVLALVAVAVEAKAMDEAQLAAWLRERVGLDP